MKNKIFLLLSLSIIFSSFSFTKKKSNEKQVGIEISFNSTNPVFSLPNYDSNLDLKPMEGGSCSCAGVFVTCMQSCSSGDCSCTCGFTTCVCTPCSKGEEDQIAKAFPVSIDKKQYNNFVELASVLEKNSDKNAKNSLSLLKKMINYLRNKNYTDYHITAMKFEKSLSSLDNIQRKKLNLFFEIKGADFRV